MKRTHRPGVRTLLVTLACVAGASPSPQALRAQSPDLLANIDRVFEAYRLDAHIPGMVYGIVIDGRLVHVKGLGVQDVDSKRPVTEQTLFRIASMTKSFTALSILKLRDEGKLSLEDMVDIMPGDIHVGSGAMVALWDPPGIQINIRNLINMAIRVSDNSAADILLNRVEAGNVTQRMKMLGLDSIRVDRSTLEMIPVR